MGQEASEIDYFLHNIKEGEYLKKTVLQNLPENTSDHHPIKLSIDFEYSLQPMKQKDNKPGITKCRFSTSDGFPLSLQILYFDLEFEIAVLISLVHTFSFGFALKIALFDEEVIAADFMISQILSIFSHPIKLSIDFEYSLQPMKQKDNKPGITKVKWEKVDKEWYEVISCKCRFSTSDGFPVSLQILYFDLEFEIAVIISFVHTFNFGFALQIAFFDIQLQSSVLMVMTTKRRKRWSKHFRTTSAN
jgi:uncharacterized membrane protein